MYITIPGWTSNPTVQNSDAHPPVELLLHPSIELLPHPLPHPWEFVTGHPFVRLVAPPHPWESVTAHPLT
jgi:hypothetical protein